MYKSFCEWYTLHVKVSMCWLHVQVACATVTYFELFKEKMVQDSYYTTGTTGGAF